MQISILSRCECHDTPSFFYHQWRPLTDETSLMSEHWLFFSKPSCFTTWCFPTSSSSDGAPSRSPTLPWSRSWWVAWNQLPCCNRWTYQAWTLRLKANRVDSRLHHENLEWGTTWSSRLGESCFMSLISDLKSFSSCEKCALGVQQDCTTLKLANEQSHYPKLGSRKDIYRKQS